MTDAYPCSKKIQDYFMVGCGTSIAIVTFARCISDAFGSTNKRRIALAAASFCGFFMSLLYSLNLQNNNDRSNPHFQQLAAGAISFTYATHAFLISASFDRYFILFPEKLKRKMKVSTKLFAYVVLMFVLADGVRLIIIGQGRNAPGFLLSQLIILIPLQHMVFGVVAFIKSVKKMTSRRDLILTIQPVITLGIIGLWFIWIATVATGSWGAGSSCLLITLAVLLESSAASITQSVQTISHSFSQSTSSRAARTQATVSRSNK